MSQHATAYIHGTRADEQQRLARLNGLVNSRCIEQIRPAVGERVLDVGSGLGQMTRLLGRATGVRALGVEFSPEQIREAERFTREANEGGHAEFRQGDAGSLPLTPVERGSFDLVHTRFVLEHVTDPLTVVREMVSAARPGGRIVLADDDHDVLRVWPAIPGLEAMWAAYMRTYDRLGCYPIVGRRLVSLLHEAGAKPLRNHWIWFGACAGDGMLPDFTENMLGVVRTARDRMVETGSARSGAFEELEIAARAWAERPDSALWFAIAYAEGSKTE